MKKVLIQSTVAAVLMAGTVIATPAYAKSSKQVVSIPHCDHSYGTVSVKTKTDSKEWWSGQGLSSPETAVKLIVKESGCFTLIDRGVGVQGAEDERVRANAGLLRRGSNIGRGQMLAADYLIVPTLLSQDTSTSNKTGFLNNIPIPFVNYKIGDVAAGLEKRKNTANVHLEIIDVRSTAVKATAEAKASKTDMDWNGFSSASFASLAVSGYVNTDQGQAQMAAYIGAYQKLVASLQTSLPAVAGSDSPKADEPVAIDSITIARAGMLRATPSVSGRVVRSLPAGSVLYPTGDKQGVWTKVSDEAGAEGWVSSLSIASN